MEPSAKKIYLVDVTLTSTALMYVYATNEVEATAKAQALLDESSGDIDIDTGGDEKADGATAITWQPEPREIAQAESNDREIEERELQITA